MSDPQSATNRLPALMPLLAAPVLLGVTLVNFLIYQSYPLWTLEVAMLAATLLAVALAFGGIHRFAPRIVQALLEASLIALFLDFNTHVLPSFVGTILILTVVIFFLRLRTLGVIAVAGLAMLAASFAGFGGTRPQVLIKNRAATAPLNNKLPPMLHIILDEQIGLDGLPRDAQSQALRSDMLAAYGARGFSLYPRAYSEHFYTVNAIPAALGSNLPSQMSPSGQSWSVGPTPYFQALAAQGYRFRVFQTDYVDLCRGIAPDRCTVFAASTVADIRSAVPGAAARATLLAWKLVSVSQAAMRLVNAINANAARAGFRRANGSTDLLVAQYSTAPVSSMKLVGALGTALASARPGEAYVAHILLPHYPYAYDPACRLNPLRDWVTRDVRVDAAVRQHAYDAQAQCALKSAKGLIDILARRGPFVSVVHGDHGSRIVSRPPDVPAGGKPEDARLPRDEMKAGYSTFVAIHVPGAGATVHQEVVSLRSLLAAFAAGRFATAPTLASEPDPTVIVTDPAAHPVGRVSMLTKE